MHSGNYFPKQSYSNDVFSIVTKYYEAIGQQSVLERIFVHF